MSDLLERAAAELIARPPRAAPEVYELRRRLNRRRGRRTAVLALAVMALMVVGLVAISGRSADNSVGNQLDQLGFDNDGTTPCGDFGCGQFDSIAVAPGVNDFYVGPASLGDPLISGQFWTAALRCVQVDASARTCTEVEGLRSVPLVTYEASGGGQIQVGTTFGGSISLEDYAATFLGSLNGDRAAVTPTTVRGHPAVSFMADQSSPALMWEERSGVVVWVTVPPSRQSELTSLAEHIELQPGPSSMPGVLVVPNRQRGGDTDNVGDLVIARFQGAECVGWGYIDRCKEGIDDRTFINRVFQGDSTIVAGAVPPQVDRVRIRPEFGEPVDVTPFSFAGFTSRYYTATLPGDFVDSVEWLAASGAVLATTVAANTDAQAGIEGWRVARIKIAGHAVQLSADLNSAGVSADGSLGAIKYTGTAVPTQPLLCTYVTLFGPYAVTCSSPAELNVSDSFDGIVFGAAGPDVASVLVDGHAVELRPSPEIVDRRFFAAAGSQVVFLDTDGNAIAVPPPIDRQQTP